MSKPITLDLFLDTIETLGLLFQSSFGPLGNDKLLFDRMNNDLVITNDGSTILKNLDEMMEPQYCKQLLNWGKTLSRTNGDGIKTFYLLFGQIVHQFRDLLKEGIPRANLVESVLFMQKQWRKFILRPMFCLSPAKIKEPQFIDAYLRAILAGKLSKGNTSLIISMIQGLIEKIGHNLLNPAFEWEKNVAFELMPGGLVKDSQILPGIVLEKEPTTLSIVPPDGLRNARIMLIREKLYFDTPDKKPEGDPQTNLELQISSPQGLLDVQNWRNRQSEQWFDAVSKFKPQIIVTLKGVDHHFEQLCIKNRIILIRRAKSEQFDALSRYLHINPVDNLQDLTESSLTMVDHISWCKIGRDYQIYIEKIFPIQEDVSPSHPYFGTVLITGSIWYICQEIERFFKKSMQAIVDLYQNPHIFYGGGNTEILFSELLLSESYQIPHKIGYAVNSFAKAFLGVPIQLFENAGLDPIAGISKLKMLLHQENPEYGLNLETKQIESMKETQIYDPYSTKLRVYDILFSTLLEIAQVDRVIQKSKKVE